ncbi:MAG: dihydropteroate synthase [Lachnospiraceae bacterium]|nr:dihydropteroate synthase [Lachnospiraceae bacterium]
MLIGGREFDTDKETYIMGILNMTPDSFSDGGSYADADAGCERAREMMEEGADIIDVGGLSTRPGYTEISEEEEAARIVPVIKKIKQLPGTVISVDTYRPSVAEAAIEAGADLINDVSCLKEERLAQVAAKTGAAYCLMHNRNAAKRPYTELLADVIEDIREGLEKLKAAGVGRDRIMIDPGIGFAKDYEENLKVLAGLGRFAELGYPVLLGISRKSVIGNATGLPVGEREEGTIALNVYGMTKKVSFIRVHDVKGNARAVKMMREVLRYG